jgi:hypothetical protein
VSPVALDGRLHGSTQAVARSLRYHLRDFDWEYVAVTAPTDTAATPHEHIYIWADDGDNQITAAMARPAIEQHVEKVADASEEHHRSESIIIRHDPPLVDHTPDGISRILTESAVADDGRVPVNTAGAQYLASQLPHLVVRDVFDSEREVSDVAIDGGVVGWATPHNWVRSSRGIELSS